jgi:hypothetical protein
VGGSTNPPSQSLAWPRHCLNLYRQRRIAVKIPMQKQNGNRCSLAYGAIQITNAQCTRKKLSANVTPFILFHSESIDHMRSIVGRSFFTVFFFYSFLCYTSSLKDTSPNKNTPIKFINYSYIANVYSSRNRPIDIIFYSLNLYRAYIMSTCVRGSSSLARYVHSRL